MVVLEPPPVELQAWLDKRRALGQDRFDEVWQGVYHVAPAPHPQHGAIEYRVLGALRTPAATAGLIGLTAFDLGRPDDYRVLDHGYVREMPEETFVATAAMLVEILSPDDETWAKQDFYFAHGVAELVVVDPVGRTVSWLGRGRHRFEARPGSAILGMSTEELAVAIGWPAG